MTVNTKYKSTKQKAKGKKQQSNQDELSEFEWEWAGVSAGLMKESGNTGGSGWTWE